MRAATPTAAPMPALPPVESPVDGRGVGTAEAEEERDAVLVGEVMADAPGEVTVMLGSCSR